MPPIIEPLSTSKSKAPLSLSITSPGQRSSEAADRRITISPIEAKARQEI
jgi:hypothetical protein